MTVPFSNHNRVTGKYIIWSKTPCLWTLFLFIYLFIHLFIYLFVCLFISDNLFQDFLSVLVNYDLSQTIFFKENKNYFRKVLST